MAEVPPGLNGAVRRLDRVRVGRLDQAVPPANALVRLSARPADAHPVQGSGERGNDLRGGEADGLGH